MTPLGGRLAPISRLGQWSLERLNRLKPYVRLIGKTGTALRDVSTYRPLLAQQAMEIGVRSLPLILYISIFTGMVLSLQAVRNFFQTIPAYFTGVTVAKTTLQEFSSVITALVLAGRVGASMAAELGSMRVTEQIDALESMGYDSVAYLVVPRVMGGFFMLPVLTIFSALISILAGWITAVMLSGMTSYEFFKGVKLMSSNADFILPLVKSALFGLAITLIACKEGLGAGQGARGVGTAATQAAVVASVSILTLDFVVGFFLLH